jgi:phage tail sheath protein FI
MPGSENRSTPGVYITELNAFPPTVVGVQTAIPAFIGYTQRAIVAGTSARMKPIAVSSMAAFEQYFGTHFKPLYQINPLSPKADQTIFDLKVSGVPYTLDQEGKSQFYLYFSMRLFYANGGGNCYVVSVGDYTDAGTSPQGASIDPAKLIEGLESIANQVGPTMLVVPDAMLLTDAATDPPGTAYGKIATAMLAQCYTLQDRVAILDVFGCQTLTQATLQQNLPTVVSNFKEAALTSPYLSYGIAYLPMLNTSVAESADVDYTYFDPAAEGGQTQLQQQLTAEAALLFQVGSPQMQTVTGYIAQITKLVSDPAATPAATAVTQAQITTLNQNLSNAIPNYQAWQNIILSKMNVLPPSAGMAGIFTALDNLKGVWNAPSNMSMSSVSSCTVKLNDVQQGALNVPLDGKAIDVLRDFPNRGTVVWGARTLDSNSNDWRYIQARRTIVYVEQSVKAALQPFMFAANNGQTWVSATSMISDFLQGLWTQGGLMGDKSSDAFTVQCGLGSTMTAEDILNGYMVVQVTLQLILPAEFIELTFKQQMQGA